jgi:hypothetical protein
MTTERSLIDSALRGWKSNVERADKLFGALSPEQLEQEVAPGKNRLIYLWGHLAAVEPINTLLEMGLASIVSFRATASAQDAEGNFTTDWETVFGGTYSTGIAVRWRTVRAWKSRMVIAERIEDQPSPNP